ncbi:uncharacterized protein KY384_005370 [Bacidia gigantensis]|uniref:uncharacterized protein n=1 Tax=Bacidia gigantensis TaxID=2732470 RepID=UPI001D059CF0|nr:uncharacterized protein KY384_005370 [Bacidia gigantensis]KAG8529889.1 hypothetical protein KY384_005370 [Bacidia gigantensis]
MAMKLLFLPEGGYFFDSGKKAYWTPDLDSFLADLLACTSPVVEQIFDIAFANKAAFISFKTSEQKLSISHNLTQSSPILASWLDTKAHARTQIRVSVGTNPRTFFAVSDQGFRWAGVDDEFHGILQEWLTGAGTEGGWKSGYEPDGALFGVNGGYLITCKEGRHLAWNKKLAEPHGYPGLTARLTKRFTVTARDEQWYKYITLNPHVPDEWVVIWADGSISYNLSKSFQKLFGPVMEYLSSQPGFFDISPMKPSTSFSTLPIMKRPASYSPSLQPGPSRPQHSNPLPPAHTVAMRLDASPQPVPYHYQSHERRSFFRPRPQANVLPARPPYRPAQSSPWPIQQPSTMGFPPQTSPFGQATDTTSDQLHQVLEFWKGWQDQMSQTNQSIMNSAGGSGNAFSYPTFDPTGGSFSGGDPTGGLLTTGGGFVMPVDPSSMLMMGGMPTAGFDPTGMSYGCTVM